MKEKCCGNCKHFNLEDSEGNGWCECYGFDMLCNESCDDHESDLNGWTEITQDNEEEVYNINPNRLAIAWVQGGMTICRLYQDVSPTISTMAKLRGYYYMELPEIEIE